MDFLKKAKKTMAELEGDLNKATAALGLNKKDEGPARAAAPVDAAKSYSTPGASSFETPSSTAMNTPATSVAPSTVGGGPTVKLPLAIRKSVRDDWETRKPEFETKISTLLGVPWTIPIDYVTLWPHATEGAPKTNPGEMITSYIVDAISNLEKFLKDYGDDGKAELNQVAYSHTIFIAQTKNPKITCSGCEIVNGSLQIVFAKEFLGYNTSQATSELSTAVNEAGSAAVAAAPGGATPVLDFDSHSNIKAIWDPKAAEVQAEIAKILSLPVLTLTPNFEHNAVALAAFDKVNERHEGREDWRLRMGEYTLVYFESFRDVLGEIGFGKDEMLQEAFQDAVDKNEIQLRVVEKLAKGLGTNECVIENGVLIIQTMAKCWTYNSRDPATMLVDML